MESHFFEEAEENASIRIWSEKTQFEKGDSLSQNQMSKLSGYTHVHTKQNDLRELKEIWDYWDDEMKREFYHNYGDITYLLDVKVEKPLLRAITQHWNAAYSCFTLGEVDLTPTIEEYTALFRCPRFQEDKVYTKAPKDRSFRKKLMALTEASEQWVDGQIQKKGESFCISWRCLRNLIRTHPKPKKRTSMFALAIYGLVIFPKVLGHVEAAVLDIFDRLDKGVTPIPAVLAETFRSLTACQKNGEGRFIGCAQLLMVWFWSHFKRMAGNLYRVHFEDYSPLRDFLKHSWIDDVTEEQWLSIFLNFQEKDVIWKAPWMTSTSILFRCGTYDWVPLPGLWGGTAYAPLMVSRQYSSRQFIPATQGLQEANLEYQGENYREKIHQVSVSWNQTQRMRTFSGNPRVVPEYHYWRNMRNNDSIPSGGFPVPIEEHLRVIPTEVEILKQDFEEKNSRLGKRIAELEDEKFHLGIDVDIQKEEVRATKKGKGKVEDEFLWKEDYRRLLAERKMAGLGKTSGQWKIELQREKEEVNFWKMKHEEMQTQRNTIRQELLESQSENENLRAQVSELRVSLQEYQDQHFEERMEASYEETEMLKEKIAELEESLQDCQERLESFEKLQAYEKAQWESKLRYSERRVEERDDIMGEALVQVREVAEYLQTLAVQADVLSIQMESESDRGKKLAALFREIKLLSLRAKPYM